MDCDLGNGAGCGSITFGVIWNGGGGGHRAGAACMQRAVADRTVGNGAVRGYAAADLLFPGGQAVRDAVVLRGDGFLDVRTRGEIRQGRGLGDPRRRGPVRPLHASFFRPVDGGTRAGPSLRPATGADLEVGHRHVGRRCGSLCAGCDSAVAAGQRVGWS